MNLELLPFPIVYQALVDFPTESPADGRDLVRGKGIILPYSEQNLPVDFSCYGL